jgi:hypothetical protein
MKSQFAHNCFSALVLLVFVTASCSASSGGASTKPDSTSESTGYSFPSDIYPGKRYLIYLHGKILEDQGLPAVSVDFGEYEYESILRKLESYGFVVISAQRPINAEPAKYAQELAEQISALIDAGVPPEAITIVGASKGAYIGAMASNLLKNTTVNFVLLGSCFPAMIEQWKRRGWSLNGHVLAIYDSADLEYAGSCEELFALADGNGLRLHDEIVLNVGTGHGILYKPLDEWILPTVDWANNH